MPKSRDPQYRGPIDESDNEPDISMISLRGGGTRLITAETALEMARRIHTSTYGADDLAANEPLTITSRGDNWLVRGSKRAPPFPANPVPDGPFTIKISQFDGRILSYLFDLHIE